MHQVKLLAVVLVWLNKAVSRGIAELSTKWIIVHFLDDSTLLATISLRHLTDISEVILIIVAESEIIHSVIVSFRLTIALIKLILVYASVLHNKASTKKIVARVCILKMKCFLFTLLSIVCSNVVHYEDKSKQKFQYHQE